MPTNPWETIASTPWWVFLVIGLIFRVSFQARHPRTVPIYQLLMIPLYLVFLATLLAIFTMHPHADQYFVGLGGLSLGIALGWLQFARLSPSIDLATRQIRLPGSNWPLVLVVTFFAAKLIIGFPLFPSLGTDSTLITRGQLNNPILALYGMMAGLALGRYFFAKYALNRALS